MELGFKYGISNSCFADGPSHIIWAHKFHLCDVLQPLLNVLYSVLRLIENITLRSEESLEGFAILLFQYQVLHQLACLLSQLNAPFKESAMKGLATLQPNPKKWCEAQHAPGSSAFPLSPPRPHPYLLWIFSRFCPHNWMCRIRIRFMAGPCLPDISSRIDWTHQIYLCHVRQFLLILL